MFRRYTPDERAAVQALGVGDDGGAPTGRDGQEAPVKDLTNPTTRIAYGGYEIAGQRSVLAKAGFATRRGDWLRAATSGERVTLASLYRRGLLVRRCHRGAEGEANAAHEYRVSQVVLDGLWF